MAAQVGFVFELLYVITIAACEQPPVEVARIVTRRVLAVFSELDGEAVIRAAMNARPESLNDNAGAQLQILDTHQRARMDERAGSVLQSVGHQGITSLLQRLRRSLAAPV